MVDVECRIRLGTPRLPRLVVEVAVQRHGLVVALALRAVEADRDEGFDQGRAFLEAGGAFDVV